MELFQTVMGKRFFESTMPSVAKNLGRIADALEKLNEKKNEVESRDGMKQAEPVSTHSPDPKEIGNKVFTWPSCNIDATGESMFNAARECTFDRNNERKDLFSFVAEEIMGDDDGKPASLIDDYIRASDDERRVIDGVMAELTGWYFPTLVRKWVESGLEQAVWKTPEGYISIQYTDNGWDYTLYSADFELIDGGQVDDPDVNIVMIRDQILEDRGWDAGTVELVDYDEFEDKALSVESERK